MKRIVLGLLSTISVVTLLFGYHTSTSGGMTSTPVTPFTASAQPSSAGTTQGNGASGAGGNNHRSTAAASKPKAAAKTVTGPTVNTRWGPVQVQLKVASGSITNVSVLQYPTGNSTDEQINGYALPILVRDTLLAQGHGVHMVSGATVTSTGYLESLQGALDQARL